MRTTWLDRSVHTEPLIAPVIRITLLRCGAIWRPIAMWSHSQPALTPEQIDQIATAVRDNFLQHQLDTEVDRAMCALGIDAEITDEDWQAIADQVFS